ncbi:hypothetical protein KUL42_32860 [Alteromonas sp. KUL42]|uniref:hypothetical protein n=1 Tax=Alteromonas sp. KUL42 TaxID=2480797 RepID=UPI001035DCE5|nr:hypothetical protein [Alteromonas sp. KUL42]TAP33300.1 hypothetical protein EYR97_15470 [Alteromonas sp. KUL42]GEA08525.1 hypothetical protein KUL42_32860 [Alteromonas sp. KUL42]
MSDSETMIEALRVLSQDIQSGDGVANACVADAADMIESMSAEIIKANERVRELEKRNNNQSKTIEAMEGCIAREIAKAFEKAEIPRRAKAGCIGEFKFTIEKANCCPECYHDKKDDCEICEGDTDENGLADLTATVPWDLCKDIWLRMNRIYAEELREGKYK